MARNRLYKTAKELIVGYGLGKAEGDPNEARGRKGGSERRKVYLRGRLLANERVGLYVVTFQYGKKVRRTVGTLNPELTTNVKTQNEEVLRMARANSDLLNSDAERLNAGFAPIGKANIRLIDYVDKVANACLAKTGNKHGYYYSLMSLNKHLLIFRKEVKLNEVDDMFVKDFIKYLDGTAKNINYHRAKDKKNQKDKTLSVNSQHRLFANLHYVIKKAKREKLIINDPFDMLEPSEKPKEKKGTREYLTMEEVKKLMMTECSHQVVRNAFLFCCFVGLRYSDVQGMTWGNIGYDESGLCVTLTMKKTQKPLKAYISDIAQTFLPERGDAKDTDCVFALPKNDHANAVIHKWAVDAGIKKNVSFHVSRHTSATMLLNLNVPLEVVAKQLGHGKITTTMIYAKIMGKTQSAAVNKQNNLFRDVL